MGAILLGVGLLVLFWAWIGLFFARVRPCIMAALGRRLGVRVAESTDLVDAGTYDVTGPKRPLGATLAVIGADLLVLLVGTVGVAALIFVPVFVAAERGWLLPLDARLTGRSATLKIIGFSGMPQDVGKARFTLAAESTGDAPLMNCIVATDGYTSRNGYLRGVSAPFDLVTGSPRTVEVDLDATRPPLGDLRFMLELECSAERVAVADGTLQVR